MRILKRACKVMLAVMLVCSGSIISSAQDHQTPFSLEVDAHLVIQTVSVKDKSGNPIEGLKKEDFVLTEDGVPQTIRVFEFEKFDDSAPLRPPRLAEPGPAPP